MEEVKDLRYEQGKGPEALINKIAAVIPGYQGYMEREKRRDADKRHREYIGTRLSNKKAALGEIGEELVDSGQMQFISKLDDLTMTLDTLSNKVRAAVTGGNSVFFDIESDTELLDRIYEHDLALLQSVEALDTNIETLSDAVDSEDNVKAGIKGVAKALKGVEASLELRDKIVRGLE